MGPQVGISFCVFGFIQPLLLSRMSSCGKDCRHSKSNPHRPEYLLVASTIAASVAGFISKSITYPFELAKRRLQIGKHNIHHVRENMVGYEKNDSMTPNQKLIAGCVSGVITRFITQPLDVIKLRTQLQKQRCADCRIKWFKTSRRIYREEGVTAFWQGHNLGQIHSVLAVSSQFFVYEMATKYAAGAPVDDKYKKILVFLSGIFAGCSSTALVLPLEVIRVRQMLVKEQYRGFLNGAREVYRSGGILAFYEGLNASLLQMGPQVGISFCVFGFIQPLLLSRMSSYGKDCRHSKSNPHRPEYLLVASTIAASVAGFISKSITYPFELAKRRLQIGSHKESKNFQAPSTSRDLIKCTRLTECMLQSFKHHGIRGLYQGWKVTIYKAQLTSVVAFTSYELLCYGIREAHIND